MLVLSSFVTASHKAPSNCLAVLSPHFHQTELETSFLWEGTCARGLVVLMNEASSTRVATRLELRTDESGEFDVQKFGVRKGESTIKSTIATASSTAAFVVSLNGLLLLRDRLREGALPLRTVLLRRPRRAGVTATAEGVRR